MGPVGTARAMRVDRETSHSRNRSTRPGVTANSRDGRPGPRGADTRPARRHPSLRDWSRDAASLVIAKLCPGLRTHPRLYRGERGSSTSLGCRIQSQAMASTVLPASAIPMRVTAMPDCVPTRSDPHTRVSRQEDVTTAHRTHPSVDVEGRSVDPARGTADPGSLPGCRDVLTRG